MLIPLWALAMWAMLRALDTRHITWAALAGLAAAAAMLSKYWSAFLLVALYHGLLNGISGLLFGTFVGIADGQVTALIVVAAVAIALVAVAGRPLLFASLDDEGAAAAGVPVRALGAGFLLLLGLAVAATAQITGTLLVFTLLVTPAATAQALTVRPGAGLVLAVAISLLVTWLGLGIAYFSPLPVGFWITSLSFGLYVLARAWRALRGGRR